MKGSLEILLFLARKKYFLANSFCIYFCLSGSPLALQQEWPWTPVKCAANFCSVLVILWTAYIQTCGRRESTTSAIWRCVVRCVVPDVSKYRVAFRASSPRWVLSGPFTRDEGNLISRNVANHPPNDAASCSRSLESSASVLWNPLILLIH